MALLSIGAGVTRFQFEHPIAAISDADIKRAKRDFFIVQPPRVEGAITEPDDIYRTVPDFRQKSNSPARRAVLRSPAVQCRFCRSDFSAISPSPTTAETPWPSAMSALATSSPGWL